MRWAWIILAALAVLIVLGVLVKFWTSSKFKDIDGLGQIRRKGSRQNVIASFGEDELQEPEEE